MSGDSSLRPLPDALLERYLADDLSEAQRREVASALKESKEAQERLAFLEKGREEFLLADPPGQFAHRLVAQLELERVMKTGNPRPLWRRWLTAFAFPSLAIATIGVVAISVSDELSESSPLEDAVLQESLSSQEGLADHSSPQKDAVGELAQRNALGRGMTEKKVATGKEPTKRGPQKNVSRVEETKGLAKEEVGLVKAKEPQSKSPIKRPKAVRSQESSAAIINMAENTSEGRSSQRAVDKVALEPPRQREVVLASENKGKARGISAGISEGPSSAGNALRFSKKTGALEGKLGMRAKTVLGSSLKLKPLGHGQAQSRAITGGLEILFLLSGNYHCMVVVFDRGSIKGRGTKQSQECKRGQVRLVVSYGDAGTGLGEAAYVVTSSGPFRLTDVKLLNGVPRVTTQWTGTLPIVHRKVSDKE